MACEGDFGVTLAPLFPYDGGFVATLGALGGHFWHLRTVLGALWDHFGVTWGAFAAYRGDFGATLGSFLGHFGVSSGICG